MVFLYRNLTSAERAAVSKDNPDLDWSTFPPAVDEDGPFYLERFLNEFCDNAKQDSYHTAAGIQLGINNFVEACPWLDKERRCFLQSDGAVNYHDPTTEVDLYWIGSRCFSEAGEGKDWIDSNSAIVKSIMRRSRDQGNFFQQNACEYFVSAEEHVPSGNTNCVVQIDSSGNRPVTENKFGRRRKCVEGIRNFGLFSVDSEKDTITFWKSLDYLESEKCMGEGGVAVGYGPGWVMTLDEFNDVHRSREENYDARIEMMGSTEKSTRAHKGKEEQDEERRLKEQNKQDREDAQKKRKADALAVTRCEDNGIEFRCSKCRESFLTNRGLQTHMNRNICKDKAELTSEKDKTRNIKKLLGIRAIEEKEKRDDTIKKLSIVEMTLKPCEFKSHGIELEEVEGRFVVKMVAEGSPAFRTYLVDEGYVLTKVNGSIPDKTDCLDNEIEVRLQFRRPTSPIPWRGYALKDFHQRRTFKMLDEQKKWLEEAFIKFHPTGLRAEGYKQVMMCEFQYRLRDDIDAPFWLFEPQISDWLKAKKADIKQGKKAAAVEKKKKSKTIEPKSRKAKGKEKVIAEEEVSSDYDSDEWGDGVLSEDEC